MLLFTKRFYTVHIFSKFNSIMKYYIMNIKRIRVQNCIFKLKFDYFLKQPVFLIKILIAKYCFSMFYIKQ